jgi:hypothetical protein
VSKREQLRHFLVHTERPASIGPFTFSALTFSVNGRHDSLDATARRCCSDWCIASCPDATRLSQADVSVERCESCGLPVRALSNMTRRAAALKGAAEPFFDLLKVSFRSE